jgi:CheY-like chemotaxis protein
MPRALVVDDIADIRLVMRLALEPYGFQVTEAASGYEALDAFGAGQELPDLVVLDVQMPDLDGWETLRAIRGNPITATLPVIMCTVKARPQDMAQGWELGCDGYVSKPFGPRELADEARSVLSRSEEERTEIQRAALTEWRAMALKMGT